MKRLVRFTAPDGTDTPLDLLRQLRELDETAELVCIGPGPKGKRWWLGCVRPNRYRTERAEVMLAQLDRLERDTGRKPNPVNLMLADLLQQGFARVQQYIGNDPAGAVIDGDGYPCSIVEDFRERCYWNQSADREAKVRERIATATKDSEREAGQRELAQYMATDARGQYRRLVKERSMFGAAGQTGGARGVEHAVAEVAARKQASREQQVEDNVAAALELAGFDDMRLTASGLYVPGA